MSYILLHKNAIHSNLNLLAKKAGGIEKIFAVLKDNAYGHGLEIFANEIAKIGVKRAVVRDLDEALKIEYLFEDILVLSEKNEKIMPINKIIFAINSLESLKNVPKNTTIALKIDTGMHRNGIYANELDEACKLISQKSLNLHSIFTHFRAADELGSEYFWQKREFSCIKQMYNDLKKKYKLKDTLFHSHNSAGLLRATNFHEDFARVGIAMYGYDTLPNSFDKTLLKPVLELFAQKISQKSIKKGEKIGYSGIYTANENMGSSLYDLGYGDGVFRHSKNDDLRTTNNCKILGKISMDAISIQSDLEAISIFHDASSWAQYFNTIVYDILVKLSPKIERKLI